MYQWNFKSAFERWNPISEKIDFLLVQNGVSDSYRRQLMIVLEEMISNVILHGNDTKTNINITLEIVMELKTQQSKYVEIHIIDDGIKFNPFSDKARSNTVLTSTDKPGGWGLMITRNLVDECQYSYINKKNYIKLIKNI